MKKNEGEQMDLDQWLQEKNIHPMKLAKMLGKCRTTIWRARRNLPIDSETAKVIYLMTGGQVNVPHRQVGRAKGFKVKK